LKDFWRNLYNLKLPFPADFIPFCWESYFISNNNIKLSNANRTVSIVEDDEQLILVFGNKMVNNFSLQLNNYIVFNHRTIISIFTKMYINIYV
jgi:hypothetical protein